jgi:hypothetical protein
MRLMIEAGTDAGSVCCFDPAALPADFDRVCEMHAFETVERLAEEGRFWWGGDGDGGYLLHFYIDEEPPADVIQQDQDFEEIASFQVPSGKLVACGIEYAASDPL